MPTANPAAWIQVVFVSFLAAIAWLRPLSRSRQLKVSLLALIAIVAIVLEYFSRNWLTPPAYSTLRDWLPAALLLIPYWQVGQFFTGSDPDKERWLAEFDRRFFQTLRIEPAKISIGTVFASYLELSYVLVYPLIPLGLLVLDLTGMQQYINYYWIVVLPATYICFGITPFVQAMPPRSLANYEKFNMPLSPVRKMNSFILRRGSIQAITFPSAHVGSAAASALVLLRIEPLFGLIFLVIALSIAVSTVVGGYHYAADVLLASFVAVFIFAVTFWTLQSPMFN